MCRGGQCGVAIGELLAARGEATAIVFTSDPAATAAVAPQKRMTILADFGGCTCGG